MRKVIVFMVVLLLAACGNGSKEDKNVKYDIINFEESGKDNLLKVKVPDDCSKTQMINISAELRVGFEQKKFVIFFYTDKTGYSTAFATTTYFPNCKECATDIDKYGDPIQFKKINL